MKFPFAAALLLLALGFRPAVIHAQDTSDDTLPAAVAQLFTDLAAIPAGSTVTDAQHQALVTDLDALAAGVFTPDPDDVDQLATDLGTAASSGLVSTDFETELAADFSADSGDPDDQDGWLDDIEDDVADVLSALAVPDPTGTYFPTYVLTTSLGSGHTEISSGFFTRALLPLAAQGIPPGLLENYAGSVRLATSQPVGSAAVSKLTVRTSGLPPSNPYTVSITRQSDGATVAIGKLHVRNGFYFLTAQALAARPAAELSTSGHAAFGGIMRLSGSVAGAQPTRQVRGVTLRLAPASASGISAKAFANAFVRHAVASTGTTDHFHLSAHHLPVNATVTLLVNGTAAGQFPTTAKGRLVIAEGTTPTSPAALTVYPLPAGTNLSDVKSLALVDAQGGVLVSGSLGD